MILPFFKNKEALFQKTLESYDHGKTFSRECFRVPCNSTVHVAAGTLYLFNRNVLTYICSLTVYNLIAVDPGMLFVVFDKQHAEILSSSLSYLKLSSLKINIV